MLPEIYLESDIQYEKPYTRKVEFQTDLDTEQQTEDNLLTELREKATNYLEENKYPKFSYTVKSDINQNLEIGDTIHVLHPIADILTEVLEYEYDEISEKVKSLTFGNFARDVQTKFNNIKTTIEQLNQTLSKQIVTINKQSDLINSLNKNGYVYIDNNEILILDKLPKNQAVNVWRLGLGGIGFSSNGYEGPFEIAMTIDGQINANFITTGTLSVDRIEGLGNQIQMIVSNQLEDGVKKVKTETGYTFDGNGLTIEKTNAKTKSTLNEIGLNIKDATGSDEESLLFAGYDNETGETVVKSKNMTVEKYLTIGSYSRVEDYEEGTGVFWIGGLYGDNNRIWK